MKVNRQKYQILGNSNFKKDFKMYFIQLEFEMLRKLVELYLNFL